MKKLTLLILFICSSIILFGQEEQQKQNNILGGSFNVSYQHQGPVLPGFFTNVIVDGSSVLNYSINPYIGFGISPHAHVGISANFYAFHQDNERINGQKRTSVYRVFGPGIFYRYNFNPDKKFSVFIEPSVGLVMHRLFSKLNSSVLNKASINTGTFNLSGGILYKMNKRFNATLRTGAFYLHYGKSDTDDILFHVGSSLNLSSLRFGVELNL